MYFIILYYLIPLLNSVLEILTSLTLHQNNNAFTVLIKSAVVEYLKINLYAEYCSLVPQRVRLGPQPLKRQWPTNERSEATTRLYGCFQNRCQPDGKTLLHSFKQCFKAQILKLLLVLSKYCVMYDIKNVFCYILGLC